MGTFEIIKRNGQRISLLSREPFCAVTSAVQNISLMGNDNVQISFVSDQILDLTKGDKILVFGEEYTIRTKITREMMSDSHFVYNATFYGVMYELMKSQYRNTDANGKSTKSTFDLTYTIKEFVKVLIYNVSRDYPGIWTFDEDNCPDTEPLTIQFSRQNCLQVLQTLCSEENFNLEFRITQNNGVRTIHIGKFGSIINPPGGNSHFEWGKGLGLYSLKEDKVDDKAIITRLWVEGGATNIRSGYRDYSDRLQLPFPQRVNAREHTLADGTVVAPGSQIIGIKDDAKRYFEDAALRDAIGSDEDTEVYDDIFPSRTGSITALVADDLNSFIDTSMDFDLNEKDENGETKWLVGGVTAKINFITGKLAGQQFELKADGGYDHSLKKFTIISYTDERGLKIPTTDNEAFRLNVGDQYKITDINLPDSYIQRAEEDLWYAGLDDFNTRKQARAQYTLTLDRKYFMDAVPEGVETAIFKVGDFVPVKDTRFGIEKNIRIQKISRNLLLEQDYSLTLSDITAISIATQTVIGVMKHEQIITNNQLKDLNKARKGWRTTEELRTMVYDTDGYFDTENIRPNSIDTNMLTVGSKSQQFVLTGVILEPNLAGNGNRFNATAGILSHLTIDEDAVRAWNMSAAEFTLENTGGYYLYAKCSKQGTGGVWYLSQQQLRFEIVEDPNNYYFQVGILSSLYEDGFRDFNTTYGFTRINGNTITTGKITTSDGECYIDLDGNKFRIGNALSSIDWNVTADGQLTLKNVKLMSGSGDLSEIGVYRGVYNSEYTYYKGDEVSYTADGKTITYRYIHNTPTAGNLPTNSLYWSVVAQGADGTDGQPGAPGEPGAGGVDAAAEAYYEYRYSKDGSTDKAQTALDPNDPNPAGWSLTMPTVGEMEYIWHTMAKKSGLTGKTDVYIPVKNGESRTLDDDSGNGYDAIMGLGASVVSINSRYALNLPKSAECTIPYDLPFRENFTLCFWVRTDQTEIRWMFIGYNGRDYVENKIDVTANTWCHLAFRFNGNSVAVLLNGSWIQSGTVINTPVGFSLYDNNMFGSNVYFDDVRILKGALPQSDITRVMNGTADSIVIPWSTPIRITPVNGKNGSSPVMIYRGEIENNTIYYGNSSRVDAVYYNGKYYIARVDAEESSGITPGTGFNSSDYPITEMEMWNELGTQFESVATKLLLAEKSYVKNLIAEEISMRDADNNVIFEAKDGNVICNKGTFKDINVTGNLNLNKLTYGINEVDSDWNILGTMIDFRNLPDYRWNEGQICYLTPLDGSCREVTFFVPDILVDENGGAYPTIYLRDRGKIYVPTEYQNCFYVNKDNRYLQIKQAGIYTFIGITNNIEIEEDGIISDWYDEWYLKSAMKFDWL